MIDSKATVKERSGEVGNAGYCRKCEKWAPDGPDLCLGRLPGVTAACCGHGYRTPYVAFGIAAFDYDPNTITTLVLYGPSAEEYFAHTKRAPGEPFLIDAEAWKRYEDLSRIDERPARPGRYFPAPVRRARAKAR